MTDDRLERVRACLTAWRETEGRWTDDAMSDCLAEIEDILDDVSPPPSFQYSWRFWHQHPGAVTTRSPRRGLTQHP